MYYTRALQMIDSVCRRSSTYNVKRWLKLYVHSTLRHDGSFKKYKNVLHMTYFEGISRNICNVYTSWN